MKTVFKTKGIYARKINPEEEFSNYQPTKLGSMWKVAIGEKEEPFYDIVSFYERSSLSRKSTTACQYCADNYIVKGEIFGIADWHKKRGCYNAQFENVLIGDNYAEFGNDEFLFNCKVIDDFLYLDITNKKTGDSDTDIYRYIPWF